MTCLHSGLKAGCKVLISNPVFHRGTLLLLSASVELLGGEVASLEAARQRLVAHWNIPVGASLLAVQVRAFLQGSGR